MEAQHFSVEEECMMLRERPQYSPSESGLTKHFTKLSIKILKLYKQYGETPECICAIQNEITRYYHSNLIKHSTIRGILEPRQQTTNRTNQHKVYRIVDDGKLKVALHITTSEFKIPIHSHPNSLNSLLVIKGDLAVKQYHFVNMKPEVKRTILEAGSCSIGLKSRYNTHTLETSDSFTAFLSIRCKAPKYTTRKSCKSQILALGISLLASLNAYAMPQFSKNTISSITQQFIHKQTIENVEKLVSDANKLRKKGESGQHDAVRLYSKAAHKNNPEAQYWLGYMHLTGMGINEDSDVALNWISAAAGQGYPPAKKLLNHILYAEVEADC